MFAAAGAAAGVLRPLAARTFSRPPAAAAACMVRPFSAAAAASVTPSSTPLPPNVKLVNVEAAVNFYKPAEALPYAEELVKEVPVVSFTTGKVVGSVTLDNRVFGVPIRQDLVHRVVRWQLAKRRTTAYMTKGIDETRGGGRKPFKQKHTGNARQGSIRAANMRGGAKCPAVKIRDWSFKLNRKVRRAGLRVALSSKFRDRRLFVIEDPVSESAKTKDVLPLVSQHAWSSASSLMVHGGEVDPNVFLACRNVHTLDFIPEKGVNVHDLIRHEFLVLTKSGLEALTQRLVSDE